MQIIPNVPDLRVLSDAGNIQIQLQPEELEIQSSPAHSPMSGE